MTKRPVSKSSVRTRGRRFPASPWPKGREEKAVNKRPVCKIGQRPLAPSSDSPGFQPSPLSQRGSWGVSYIVSSVVKTTSGAHIGGDASQRRRGKEGSGFDVMTNKDSKTEGRTTTTLGSVAP